MRRRLVFCELGQHGSDIGWIRDSLVPALVTPPTRQGTPFAVNLEVRLGYGASEWHAVPRIEVGRRAVGD